MPNISNRAIILGCAVLIASTAAFGWAVLRANRLVSASQELALLVAQSTFSEAYPSTLIEHSHPILREERPPEELNRYLRHIQPLFGPLEALQSIRGNSDVPLIPLGQAKATANYELTLGFEKSPASLQIDMLLTDSQWLVTRFELFADVLNN